MPKFSQTANMILDLANTSLLAGHGKEETAVGSGRYDYLAALYYWFLFCELCKEGFPPEETALLTNISDFIEYRELRNVLAHEYWQRIVTDPDTLKMAAEFLSSTIADINEILCGREVTRYQKVGVRTVLVKPVVNIIQARQEFIILCEELLRIYNAPTINYVATLMLTLILGEIAKVIYQPSQKSVILLWLIRRRDQSLAHPELDNLSGFLQGQYADIVQYISGETTTIRALLHEMNPSPALPQPDDHRSDPQPATQIARRPHPAVDYPYFAPLIICALKAGNISRARKIVQRVGAKVLLQPLLYARGEIFAVESSILVSWHNSSLCCYQILMTVPDAVVIDFLSLYVQMLKTRKVQDISFLIVGPYIVQDAFDLFLRLVNTFGLDINSQAKGMMSACQLLMAFGPASTGFYLELLHRGGNPFQPGRCCHAAPFLLCGTPRVSNRELRLQCLIEAIVDPRERIRLVNLKNLQEIPLMVYGMDVLQTTSEIPDFSACLSPAGIKLLLDHGADPTVLDCDRENCVSYLIRNICTIANPRFFSVLCERIPRDINVSYLRTNRQQILDRLVQYLETILAHQWFVKFSLLADNNLIYMSLLHGDAMALPVISCIIRQALVKASLLDICVWFYERQGAKYLVLYNFPAGIEAFNANREGLYNYLSFRADYQIAAGVTIVNIPRLVRLLLEPWSPQLRLNNHLNLLINAYMTLSHEQWNALIGQAPGIAKLLQQYRKGDYQAIRLQFFLITKFNKPKPDVSQLMSTIVGRLPLPFFKQ